ncbi:hypothetical protein B0O99DRAFT_613703 [Bisporella sp. PMI_857]|nr:hypothetical protein B0O99DRAFT_613703 [Bisporella sp. PMI_857]
MAPVHSLECQLCFSLLFAYSAFWIAETASFNAVMKSCLHQDFMSTGQLKVLNLPGIIKGLGRRLSDGLHL